MKRQLPQGFIDMIQSYSSSSLDELARVLASTEPETSVRLNPRKTDSIIPASLTDLIDTPVQWNPNGYYLKARPRFTLDPAIHQGLYYVQDASSMFIYQAIATALKLTSHSQPITYLDACAAPGGKTTAAIDALPYGSVIIANEFNHSRTAALVENMIKWGYPEIVVTQGDTAPLGKSLKNFVDIIAADVPCSGEGMMRKDDDAIAQWSQHLIDDTAMLQRNIIANLWPALKPGGFLIYSTCTFNRRENEENLQWILDTYDATPIPIDIAPFHGITPGINTPHPCYRFLPGKIRGEGLFIALIQKHGTPTEVSGRRKQRHHKQPHVSALPDNPLRWIKPDLNIGISTFNDKVIAASDNVTQIKTLLEKERCRVIYHGIEVATIKGRDIIPAHALIMSDIFNHDSMPRTDVDTDTALNLLSRNQINLPDGSPKGFILITHGNRPLGIVKNIGARCNNLYPAAWRVLHR